MGRVRAAFIMEQTLGHKTHYRNLREAAAEQDRVIPVWLPIQFDVRGAERLLPVWRSNWSVRGGWRARAALKAAEAREPLDVLFFHTQVTSLFSRGLMRRLPTVISLDATPINYDSVGQFYHHQPAGNGPVDRRKYEMNRLAFHSAARLVTWSHWTKRSLADDYGIDPALVRVISPGAAPAYFDIGSRRAQSAARNGHRVRLLFVGGDFDRKGGPLLLESMQGSLGERCELDVVTQADVEPRPNVRVHRDIGPNSPELRGLFEAADIFVLPTYADCLALVLMEAAAAGLPVISTTVGALNEASISGQSGLAIPSGDANMLARAIATLVDNPELRARMGRVGYRLALQKFDSRRNNHELLELIESVAVNRSSARRAA
jgi:glycosyltransferase involved in cell wall biosynthesis